MTPRPRLRQLKANPPPSRRPRHRNRPSRREDGVDNPQGQVPRLLLHGRGDIQARRQADAQPHGTTSPFPPPSVARQSSDASQFIVDPIDGTTNFVHGYPYVSISLGLAVNLVPTVGVVYNPFTATLYSAIKGKGAFLNHSTPLPLRSPPEPLHDLSTAVVCVEWGSERAGNDYQVKSETFKKLCAKKEDGGAMVHGLRSFGSAALNLCGVASGSLDVYWEAGCWPWDVCAGWVVLTEAGGIMVDGNPGEWQPRVDQRRYLAVRKGEGQKGVVEEFWGFVQGKFEVGN